MIRFLCSWLLTILHTLAPAPETDAAAKAEEAKPGKCHTLTRGLMSAEVGEFPH
jgi:hypothetical protein